MYIGVSYRCDRQACCFQRNARSETYPTKLTAIRMGMTIGGTNQPFIARVLRLGLLRQLKMSRSFRPLRRPISREASRLGDLRLGQMCGDTLVSRSSSVPIYASQAHRRHEEPPACGCVAARYVGSLGVHLGEVDLGTRQALLGRGQEPSDCPRPVGVDGIAVIVQSVAVQDTEIV